MKSYLNLSNFLSKLLHHWRVLLSDKAYVVSLIGGVAIFVLAYFVNNWASIVHDQVHFEPVGDLLLNNIPTYNLEILFTWGIWILVALTVLYPLLFKPEIGPFMFKTFGILFLVRACFITLTDVGPPEGFFYANGITTGTNPLHELIFRNDLFFSGHVAIPFLAFLLFNGSKFKWFMLFGAVVEAVTVLLMHIHYSIDVFSAFFITHGVYAISNKVFNDLNKRFKLLLKKNTWDEFRRQLRRQRRKLAELKNKI